MSRYSVLFPPSQFYKIGPFRFPVYKALMPGETKQIEAMSRMEAKTRFASIQLAKKISKDRGITVDEAVEMLSSMQEEENKHLVYEYLEDIEQLNTGSKGETELKAELVTIVMKFRGEVQFEEDEDYVRTSDWSDDDTDKLPPDILNQIFDFVVYERDGWPEGKQPADPAPTPTKPTTTKS